MNGLIVVCGARGFVGGHLVNRLIELGREVRAGTRSPDKARAEEPDKTWVRVDVTDPDSLVEAFEGADTVYYLVHQMLAGGDLVDLETRSARNALAAAEQQGVRRIVYLGGPNPRGVLSKHLEARVKTGEALRSGTVSSIELRAGMIIGAGCESWLIVRDLAMRLPVMVLPRWLKNRSQPIAIRDVIDALVRAGELETSESRAYDLPGPEVLSAKEILFRIAKARGTKPVTIGVPLLTPSLSSHWIRLVTRADYTIARKLVDGLTSDLIADGKGFWTEMDREPTPFDDAVRQALDEGHDALGRRAERFERLVAWLSRERGAKTAVAPLP